MEIYLLGAAHGTHRPTFFFAPLGENYLRVHGACTEERDLKKPRKPSSETVSCVTRKRLVWFVYFLIMKITFMHPR